MKKLAALLRLALALLRTSGFTLTHERLPDGRDKIGILRAVERAREFVALRALLRFLRVSPSRLSFAKTVSAFNGETIQPSSDAQAAYTPIALN